MVSPAMLKGMNTEVYGEGHPFGDPAWYQAYNTPYYNDTHKQFRKLMREYVDEHIMGNVHDWDEKGTIPKEMYLEAGKQGTLALCIGRPWPEKYFGPSPWGFEPDYFHELIMYDEMSRTGSVGFQWGVAGGTTIGLPPVYHHGSNLDLLKIIIFSYFSMCIPIKFLHHWVHLGNLLGTCVTVICLWPPGHSCKVKS